jgi:hypothetical protein
MAASQPFFKKIGYKTLNARQKELFNFQKIAGILADYGFNCIKLTDDWQGTDFLAYHVDGTQTLKVQLKSRLSIHRKYCNRNIWIAFPHREQWYLIAHDRLLAKVREHTDWLESRAWKKMHSYTSTSVNWNLLRSLARYKLGSHTQ